MIETKEITMSSKKMLWVLFMGYGLPWLIGALVGFVVFVILGIALDYRFLVLALIWIFLFVPLVVAFLYFFYGFARSSQLNGNLQGNIHNQIDVLRCNTG